MIDLLERIKRTFARVGADEGTVLNLYKKVHLLIIDDMGKEPPTEWAVSTIYNIINGRYEAYMPTIITTNYDSEALVTRMTPQATRDSITAEATIDRLMEMCKGIVLTGESWRQR
jgi:DNA replication protein DnaC